VAIWWDRGYALEELAHRIPMSNGTQAGADEMARLYTETIPEAAVGWLRRSGARYVVVDPQAPLFSGENRSRFLVQIRMLGRNQDAYVQFLAERDSQGKLQTRPVYLPTYYQSMAARLYLSDGEAVAGTGPWVFETEPTSGRDGRTVELIVGAHHFNTEPEATAYLSERHSARITVGCLDPGKSCVALPAVKGMRRVFSSDPLPLSPERAVRAVKVFEVMPEE
jgi:asparagine N-glycosylation enzyme membrane subunit Stt3